MQFAVPQFTDVEDKIIGPLTLKQFFVLLAAGGLCLLFWSLPISKIVAFIIDLPIAIIGIALAFASYNGRPALSYIFPFVTYLLSPKLMVFKRETNIVQVAPIAIKKEPIKVKTEPQESQDSRLKKLAYLLDQKTTEEKELIEKTQIEKISVPIDNADHRQEVDEKLASLTSMAAKLPTIKFPEMPKFANTAKSKTAVPKVSRKPAIKPSIGGGVVVQKSMLED